MTTNVTCPFCSLLCDDLSVRNDQGQLDISANACRLARQGFASPLPPAEALLKGVPATAGQAVRAAAKLLEKSCKPLIGGLGTDVDGIRAALQLAEKTGAALLHAQERYGAHNLNALQARGGIMTTLAEVKNRADTVVLVGNNVTGDYPRFMERFINNPHSLFTSQNRKLAYLGRPGRKELDECAGHAPVVISGHGVDIADDLALLRARLAQGRPAGGSSTPAAKTRKLDQVAGMIRDAEYGVLVWSPAALPQDHADLVISSIHDLLRDLNTRQRCAGLSLGGSNGGASFQNVATWQTGFPAGINFRNGCPSATGADTSDADSLLWVSAFSGEPPPALDVPTIILSASRSGAADADVYIPVGIPGVDHPGNLFRTDSIVNMPLKKVRDSTLPGAARVIRDIISEIEGKLE